MIDATPVLEAIAWAPIILAASSVISAGAQAYSASQAGKGGGGGGSGSRFLAQKFARRGERFTRKASGELKEAIGYTYAQQADAGRVAQLLGSGVNQGEEAPVFAPEISTSGRLTGPEADLYGKYGLRLTGGRALFSPMGQIVDQLISRGQDYLDPESDFYQEEFERVTGPAKRAVEAGRTTALRSITAEQRTAERDIKDAYAARGSVRNPGAIASMMRRRSETAATQTANVNLEANVELARIHEEAANEFTRYGEAFAANAVALGREYVASAPGLSSSDIAAITNLKVARAQVYANFGQTLAGQSGQLQLGADRIDEIGRQFDREQQLDIAGTLAGIAANSLNLYRSFQTDAPGDAGSGTSRAGGTGGGGQFSDPWYDSWGINQTVEA